MTKSLADDPTADNVSRRAGYEPELKRTLNSFQMFAISFAFISVVIGIFGTFDSVLANAGPVGIWLWVVAVCGQILVALVYAQFAARIPLSGSSYQWASRLANPKVGWVFGWLAVWALAIGVSAIDNALASQCLMPLLNMEPNEDTARVITVLILLIQTVLAIASTRIVALVNSAAVGVELAIVVVLGIALIVAVVVTGNGTTDNLTSRGITEGAPDYFAVGGGVMAAMILGFATLQGFDAAANMAEEARDPFRSVPRAIVGSVVAAGILGMFFLIALTVAIDDIPQITESGSPVAAIMRDQLGPVVERILLVAISLAFFAAGLVVMTGVSRIIFAMSRDARFPAHRLMRRVNPRTKTPIPATILVLVIGVVLMIALPGAALLELILASTIIPFLLYGMTIVLYLAVRRRLDHKPGAFDLGRFELPIAIAALVWILFSLFVLIASGTLTPVLVVAGLITAGAMYFGYLLKFKPETLNKEPGLEDAFEI
ncbi:APC family permease [Rhodococcus globerulus]|uniref:APC family permease n=1 Tax=Rhodococcus globerulus TaxID=33008 RepID=UPI000A5F00E6|nr:amino acid permease [Rhodococcus globerulus]